MAKMNAFSFAKALVDAGMVAEADLKFISRYVIDCNASTGTVEIYIQKFGDEEALAKLMPMLAPIMEVDSVMEKRSDG